MDKSAYSPIVWCLTNRRREQTPDGRRRGRHHQCPRQYRAAQPDADLGRALGQPLLHSGLADAVSVPERAAWRRLHRARPVDERVRPGLGFHPGAGRLHRRPFRRTPCSDHRACARQHFVRAARAEPQLHLADRLRRAARARQQRLPSLPTTRCSRPTSTAAGSAELSRSIPSPASSAARSRRQRSRRWLPWSAARAR